MTVQNLLEKMNERAFGPAFQEYLFDTYKAMAQADFPEEEKGYTAAKDYFITTLQHAEIEILSQIEANFKVKLQYAAQYAFHAGLYSGFKMPGMQCHTLFFQLLDENQKLIQQLESDDNGERQEHLTSIECAWEQRVHWAACHSFYCGYRAAVKVLTAVDGVNAFDMIPHTLLLEYHLGYTKSYDQTEQQHIDR